MFQSIAQAKIHETIVTEMGRRDENNSVLVCGCGSIGKRHMENLIHLGYTVKSWKKNEYSNEQKNFLRNNKIEPVKDLSKAIDASSAVIIATPADSHIDIAIQALHREKDIYIEKPLSNSVEKIDDLLDAKKDSIIEIGCHLRSDSRLSELHRMMADNKDVAGYRFCMGQRIDQWRPEMDYRTLASVQTDRGGGALFELVHMIDLAVWNFGKAKRVSAFLGKRSRFELKCDDYTILNIEHENGILGQIEVDMLSPIYRCDIEVIGLDAIYKLKLNGGLIKIMSESDVKLWPVNRNIPDERNQLFIRHIKHFMSCIKNRSIRPKCTLEEAIECQKILSAAKKASLTNSTELVQSN